MSVRQDFTLLPYQSLEAVFNVSKNADYIYGKKTKDQIISEFLVNFEGVGGDHDGKISIDEFIQYYTDLSVGISSDEYFSETIMNDWGIKDEHKSDVSKQEMEFIVKLFRQKLTQKTTGGHDEMYLRKLFMEFDINKSGFLGMDELLAMMIKMEIPVHEKYLAALFGMFDKSGDGQIEFEEFVHYILYNPYL